MIQTPTAPLPPVDPTAMFKRVIYEDWAAIIPIISFIATAGVFLTVSIRAMLLPAKRCEHLAAIPLEDETTRR